MLHSSVHYRKPNSQFMRTRYNKVDAEQSESAAVRTGGSRSVGSATKSQPLLVISQDLFLAKKNNSPAEYENSSKYTTQC